jgi:hypothetical protein
MPKVQCPGCGKEQELVYPLRESKKLCLRCNETFVISSESLQFSPEELAERAKQATRTQDLKAAFTTAEHLTPDSETAPPSSDPWEERGSQTDAQPPGQLKRSALKRKKTSGKGADPASNGNGDARSPYEDLAGGESDPEGLDENEARPIPKVVWVLLVGGLAAVGAAVYFFFGGFSNEQPKMKMAALPSQPSPAPSRPEPKDKEKSPKAKGEEAAKSSSQENHVEEGDAPKPSSQGTSTPAQSPSKPNAPTVKISAARLAAELASDGDQAKKKYEKKIIQVSGLFDRWADPRSPRGIFAVEGPVISFVLPKLVLARQARAELQKGRPVTVRGRFSATPSAPSPLPPTAAEGNGTPPSSPAGEGKTTAAPPSALPPAGKDGKAGDFFLQDAEILPLSPPADDIYLGKEIELNGHIIAVLPTGDKSEYPTLKLERDTSSLVDIDCLFPKSDEQELKKLMVGSFVTLSATCSGRASRGKDQYVVRFDNCRLIYTTAPMSPQIPRLAATQVLKDYEEDLRTALSPTPDFDPNAKTIAAAQLAKEFKQDSKSFEKNYRNKILVVTGKLYRKGDRNVTLDTGQTDNPLKIECYFSKQAFQQLGDGQDLIVRGLCNGLTYGQTLRLDNCESLNSGAKVDSPRLTVDFLPCKPGSVLIYDLATLPAESKGPPLVFRKVFTWTEGGIMERTITHVGRLPKGSSLSDPDAFKDWISAKTTKRYSQSELPFHTRIYGGFIEIGQEFIGPDGQSVVWEPVMKLGVKKGESWEWTRGTIRHQCKLVDIQQQENTGERSAAEDLLQKMPTTRSTATIRESITDIKRPDVYREIRHVFVKDVGEVEREEATRLPSGQMKIGSLMRLTEGRTQKSEMKSKKAEIRNQK